ncbi:hypothetical protein [Streptomyces sp. NPDC048644]|uniref:hypothetical protein n=1 Tax=Streptomyces sp. NPDC048644 TaxID=3365582 RepID=UPI00371CDF29
MSHPSRRVLLGSAGAAGVRAALGGAAGHPEPTAPGTGRPARSAPYDTVTVPGAAGKQDTGLHLSAANSGTGERASAGFRRWRVT